jgi:hypothetical protein
MAPRVDSELLLVGSLPADSADSALRSAAGFFGDLVLALPDGETGPRAAWVGYERERLVRPNPGVVVVQETESPTGIPRHAYETPVFGIPAQRGLKVMVTERSAAGRIFGYGSFRIGPDGPNQLVVDYIPYPEQLHLEVNGILYPDDSESIA